MEIKRYSLNAIVSIFLTLNAEGVKAIPCPSQIVGTALAGVICDFNTGSSVTVTNGGRVGGIAMNSYSPLSSQIVIDAGGEVSNTDSGGVGILISNSSLSNGISNSGTISSASGSGIVVSNSSTINGGIANSGLISSSQGSIYIGTNSNISGGIINAGVINSSNGTGIHIQSSSTINGGISNSGTIKGGGVDVGIAILNHSTVEDGITNSGLIEATGAGAGIIVSGTSTINGGISNSGIIRSAANAGLNLNVSNVQGNIVNSGTFMGGTDGIAIHNASSVQGSILNSGSLQGVNKGLSIYSATTISGSISNSGTIAGGSTGIAITSTSNVSGSISNSGTIQGDLYAVRIDNSSQVDHLDILGQHARVIGAVDAPTTTVNIVSGAVFNSEGTFNVDTLNIQSNAIFTMNQAITANAVNNAGIFAIGNTTQTITGNYTQNAGGVLQVDVSNASHYGNLMVSNTVDLSQSGNINVQVAGNASLHAGDVLSNVISGSSLVTPVDGFNVSDNSFIWKFTANPSGNGVNLIATIDPMAYSACQGDYCQGAANVIIGQVAQGNLAFSPYATLPSQSAFTAAASRATPELTNENTQLTQWITQSIMDRIPINPAGKLWLKPFGVSMNQNESNSVPGFQATAYGLIIGKDWQLRDDSLLGGALALGNSNMWGNSVLSGQSINSNAYQGMLYGAKKFSHQLYLAGQWLIGYGNNDTKRAIPLYADTAKGSYHSWVTNLRAQLGWNINSLDHTWMLTPQLDATYIYINQGSYKETGSVMDLSVASNNNSSLILGMYGSGAYHLTTFSNQQDLIFTGYAGVARNVLNTQPEVTATFIAGGPSFSTFGILLNKFLFRGGVGLNLANPVKPLRMNLNYDLQAGNHAYSGVGSITIIYKM